MRHATRGNAPARLPLPTDSEGVFQAWVTATARANGYRVHTTLLRTRRKRQANNGDNGIPDLLIFGKGRCFWAELKAVGNDLYDNQRAVKALLEEAGQTVYVWYPTDYEAVLAALV